MTMKKNCFTCGRRYVLFTSKESNVISGNNPIVTFNTCSELIFPPITEFNIDYKNPNCEKCSITMKRVFLQL